MTPERLDCHFWNWARWMRTGGLERLGFPSKVPVIGMRHGTDIDDMYEDLDALTAKATDAAVAGLRRLERDAIYAEYLAALWQHERVNIHVVLVVARQAVRMSLMRRGIA